MLGRQDPGGKRFDIVVVADGHRRLRKDRAGIGFRDDEVNRRAGNLHACPQGLPVRIEARERG